MESLQITIDDLAKAFKSSMDGFQKDLAQVTTSAPDTNSAPRIAIEFQCFRSFIMSALQNLQSQVALLSRLHDQEQMRSRRKMLMLHGIPEDSKEDSSSVVLATISSKLNIQALDPSCIKRSHRIGKVKDGVPRPILFKLHDNQTRDSIWFAKTKLKGSGITMSEFLNKGRHEAFMAARNVFGVSNCWTRNGIIFISAPDGTRHKITTLEELQAIPKGDNVQQQPSSPPNDTPSAPAQDSKRPKRNIKQKQPD